MQSKIVAIACAAVAATLVSGCGGGGGGGSSAAANTTIPEGLYNGITATNRIVTGLVLDDGTYYVLYSRVGNPAVIGGVVQGTGTASNGTFTSTNARDFNIEGAGIMSGSVTASYVLRTSFNGSVAGSGGSVAFTSSFSTNYDLTPSLAILAGTYTGQTANSAGAENATLTVSTTGAITGNGASGCTFTGTATPRSRGNVYNASITFGGAPCAAPGVTITGGAYFDATTKRLYSVALTAARDGGALFVGTKP